MKVEGQTPSVYRRITPKYNPRTLDNSHYFGLPYRRKIVLSKQMIKPKSEHSECTEPSENMVKLSTTSKEFISRHYSCASLSNYSFVKLEQSKSNYKLGRINQSLKVIGKQTIKQMYQRAATPKQGRVVQLKRPLLKRLLN